MSLKENKNSKTLIRACLFLYFKSILKKIKFLFKLKEDEIKKNNLKTHKNSNLKQKKLNKNLIFLKNTFKT